MGTDESAGTKLAADESQEFTSVASNFTIQNAELTDELTAQVQLLKSPTE